jgi:hypothetical protein
MSALKSALLDSVEAIVRAAKIYADMERHGDDLSTLPIALIRALRGIARETMLPEVYVQFDGRLRAQVAQLPLPEQKRIVEGGTVELLVRTDNGYLVEQFNPAILTPQQTSQVFAGGFIRTSKQQRIYLDTATSKPPKPGTDDSDTSYSIDRTRQGVVFNGHFIPLRLIRKWSADLAQKRKNP